MTKIFHYKLIVFQLLKKTLVLVVQCNNKITEVMNYLQSQGHHQLTLQECSRKVCHSSCDMTNPYMRNISNHRRCSKKSILKIFVIFTGKHLCWKLCEIFRNTCFEEHVEQLLLEKEFIGALQTKSRQRHNPL